MAYEKRICVLKQMKKGFTADGGTLTGAVYAERLGEDLTVTPRMMGLAPLKEGRYLLAVAAGGQTYCTEFTGKPAVFRGAPSIKGGVSVLLCFVRTGGEAEPLAYGSCGAACISASALLTFVGEEKKRRRPANPLPPNELPVPIAPNIPAAPTPVVPSPIPEESSPLSDRLAAHYDDEAIASADYYGGTAHEDENAAVCGEEQAAAQTGGSGACGDEAVPPRPATRGTLTYYTEVREKLEDAFAKYPRDESLKNTFPQSEWVNAGGALLGVIYGNGIPRYLCVAAKENRAEMGGKAVFVPVSPYRDDEGYYVVFQDADTGEYVTVKDA